MENIKNISEEKLRGLKGPKRTDNQLLGVFISEQLQDKKNIALYIRLAKSERHDLLEQALRFCVDYPNSTNNLALFLWKLKELKREFKIINTKNNNSISIAIDILNKNKLIIFPTDTVYGIGCKFSNKKGINKIFQIKKRPSNKPIQILINSIDQLNNFTEITPTLKKIMKYFWPGGLTIAVPLINTKGISRKLINKSDKTIGIRFPKSKWICEIIKEIGEPIASTSANDSGKGNPSCFEEIDKNVIDKVEIAFKNEFENENDMASTVIKVVNKDIELIRSGVIPYDEIVKLVGNE